MTVQESMTTTSRPYDPERDRQAVERIWRECGWIDPDASNQPEGLQVFLESGITLVSEMAGEAECLVSTAPGTIRYLDQDLPFFGVMSVTTSRIARRRGLAGRLTARAIAENVAEGGLVTGLGIFDQGYYDLLGYRNGPYEHWVQFDPSQLIITERPGVPCRLDHDDWEAMHVSRLERKRGHGGVNFTAKQMTHAEVIWTKKGFGLGYRDGSGELTHHFWCDPEDGLEHGPYKIYWMSYRNWEQFRELMALVASIGDQVKEVHLREPAGIRMQDLLRKPLRQMHMSRSSKFETAVRTKSYWQMRLCDLPGCLERTHLPLGPFRFQLRLTDPIERYLDESAPWRGVGGDYVVTLGPESSAERGVDAQLPELRASVGAFTQLWLGMRPAGGLSVTDELAGPPDLLAELDRVLCLPMPLPDWDF